MLSRVTKRERAPVWLLLVYRIPREPTRLRATGLGVSVAIGRVGAMLAPLMLTFAYQSTGAPSSALLVLIVLALPGPVAALLWRIWGEETRNVSLEEGSA